MHIYKSIWICISMTYFSTTIVVSDENQLISSAQNNQIELNVLHALNVSNEMRGVKEFKTETGDRAWRFHSAFDHVQIPPNITYEFLQHLQNQLSVEFTYRQHKKTLAALLSVNSPGSTSPWLRLVSDTKRNKLMVDYRVTEDNRVHENKFDLNKCRSSTGEKLHNWIRVLLSVDGTGMTVHVGCCNDAERQQLMGHILLKFPLDSLIYFRQEPGFKKKLLGAVSEAKLTNYVKKPSWKC